MGEALPAAPIAEPAKLYHLQPGHWEYRILAGANRGHVEKLQIERVEPDDRGATWQLETEYRIKIGPAKSDNVLYTFYAHGVGNVAEVARDDVSAVFIYRRKTLTARVLLTLPTAEP